MDKEEIIRRIKNISEHVVHVVGEPPFIMSLDDGIALHEAVLLLKEQEAVKPCVAVDTWICPKCGHALESQNLIDDKENPQVLVHEQYSFCPNCGRSVKWE